MNELRTQTVQLPDSLPDLSKFALIGREKLNAVRAEIRAIEKVGLAKEVHEQKLLEAQEIAEAVLDAEAKIGELTAKIPKATNQYALSNGDKSKHQTISDIGMTDSTVSRFERLAKHPQEIAEAKETARQEGRIVTRQDVFKTIAAKAPVPEHKNPVVEAKTRHKQFEKQKEEKTVDFADIAQDREDRKRIALDVYNGIWKCIKTATGIAVFNKTDVINEIVANTDKSQLEFTTDQLDKAIRILAMIRKRLGGL